MKKAEKSALNKAPVSRLVLPAEETEKTFVKLWDMVLFMKDELHKMGFTITNLGHSKYSDNSWIKYKNKQAKLAANVPTIG